MLSKKERNFNKGSYYRTYEASPIYTFLNASLTTLKTWLIDPATENKATQKHLPFNTMQVINNSSYDIYIYVNQGKIAKVIPSGTIMTFTRDTVPAIRNIKVYNAGTGTIAENEIEISLWKEGVTFDNAFARLHKALFKSLGYQT